jgi:hypothetical protein
MSLALAAGIAGAGMNIAKGLVGMVQTARANKGIKRLMANPVTYKRPDEYAQELGLRQEAASQQEMPGQRYLEQNIGNAASQARTASEQGAISSNVYQSQVGNIFEKQANALQDLSMQSAQWQQQQKENLISTLGKGSNYSDTEWTENSLRPWEMNMNLYQSQKQAGAQNAWGGAEGLIQGLSSFAGTKYYQDILKGLMSQNKTAQGGNQSKPVGTPYNATPNLMQGTNIAKPLSNLTPYERMQWELANQGYTNG